MWKHCITQKSVSTFQVWKLHTDIYSFSVQSRPHFCIIDIEYSILTQNKMIMESYWCKKKKQKKLIYLIYTVSNSRVADNNKGKFLKKFVLAGLKWARKISDISDYTCTSTFCVKRSFTQNWSVIFKIMFQLYNNYLTLLQ